MSQRQKLEKEEGKVYNDPEVRDLYSIVDILTLKGYALTGFRWDESIERQIQTTPWNFVVGEPSSGCHSWFPWAVDRQCRSLGITKAGSVSSQDKRVLCRIALGSTHQDNYTNITVLCMVHAPTASASGM
jgi:hypothetical protein